MAMALYSGAEEEGRRQSRIHRISTRYDDAKNAYHRLHGEWYLNIAFYLGHQWVSKATSNRLFKSEKAPAWRVRAVRNFIAMFLDIYVAKLTQNPPAWSVIPGSTDEADRNSARMCGHALEWLQRRLELGTRSIDLVKWTGFAGTGFMIPYWREDSVTGGDFALDLPSPFDIYEDPQSPTFEEAQWVIRAHDFHIEEARSLWPDVELEPTHGFDMDIYTAHLLKEVQNLQVTSDISDRKDRVLVLEQWEKSTKEFPEGNYTICTKTQILNEPDVPLMDNRIPIIPVHRSRVHRGTRGKPFVTDATDPQKEINRHLSSMLESVNWHSNPQRLWPATAGPSDWGEDKRPNALIQWSGIGAQPAYLTPPPIPSSSFKLLELQAADIERIFNIHPASRGDRPPGVRSARQQAFLVAADNMSLLEPMRWLGRGYRQLGKDLLRLWQAFKTAPQTIDYLGKRGEREVKDFYASNIQDDFDVYVDVTEMMPNNRAVLEEMIREDFKLGLIDRGEARRRLQWGQSAQDEFYAGDRDRARKESDMLLQGIWVGIEPQEDHEAHYDQHRIDFTSDRYYTSAPEIRQMCLAHNRLHEGRLSAAKARQQAPAPQKPPGPAPGMTGPKQGLDMQEETFQRMQAGAE